MTFYTAWQTFPLLTALQITCILHTVEFQQQVSGLLSEMPGQVHHVEYFISKRHCLGFVCWFIFSLKSKMFAHGWFIPERGVNLLIAFFFWLLADWRLALCVCSGSLDRKVTQTCHRNFKIKAYHKDGDMDLCFHFAWVILDHWSLNQSTDPNWWYTDNKGYTGYLWDKIRLNFWTRFRKCFSG